MSLRLEFLGAAQEVTGSMTLLHTRRGTLLVDCGMVQGHRAEARARNEALPRAAVAADAVVLTHAHIDHSGSLPTLVKRGFRGCIHTTSATRDVSALMLRDSAHIQQGDADYLNRKFGDDPGWEPVRPLYDEDDVDAALRRMVGVGYRRPFSPLPGVTCELLDAGHILGSAQVVVDVEDGARTRRIVFSGDLGRAGVPILRDPEPPPKPIDYVVMESTYGDRVHRDVAEMHTDLERVVRETVERGGKVIIPAFALGRTQEILLVLHELKRAGRLPPVPIYLDSPLANAVTAVYTLHADCYDKDARRLLHATGGLFEFPGVQALTTTEESMAVDRSSDPCILLSASGMCEAGRVLHHLRHGLGDPRNAVVIVGYMAQHTLGRRLAEGAHRVKVLGVEREVVARVEVLDAFSAHADRAGLLAYARACGHDVRSFFLVHGEPEHQEPLRATIAEGGVDVVVPGRGQVAVLD